MAATCGRCKVEKELDEFNWLNKTRGVRQRFCRDCMRVCRKESYAKHRDKQVDRVMKRNHRLRRQHGELLAEYLKTHPCVDCGESDIVVLHFDHVRGTKQKEISKLVNTAASWDKIEQEIDKCDVRCANCHTRKTAKQFGWRKLFL